MADPGDFCYEPPPEQTDEDLFAGFSAFAGFADFQPTEEP